MAYSALVIIGLNCNTVPGETPDQILEKINMATSSGSTLQVSKVSYSDFDNDIIWTIRHAAAASACAAISPELGLTNPQVIVPKILNNDCNSACTATPTTKNCRGAIAIGGISRGRAKIGSTVLATNYRYACNNVSGFDETQTTDASQMMSYCCCYGN